MKKLRNHFITFWRGGLCLLLCAACTFGFSPSRSTAETMPEAPPTFLSEQEQAYSSHIRRLDEFNDQTDVVGYLNQDGSKTVYIYADEVRYQDANGRMIDKNIHLTEIAAQEKAGSNYRYRTVANDITAYYPDRLSSSAIVWEYQGHRISLQPQCGSTSTVSLQDSTKAVYQTPFGEISCNSLLSGTMLRQTIPSTDVTSVTFDANFGDLTPLLHENTMILTDSKGVDQICFGGFMLTNSEGAASDNLNVSLQEKSNGIYTVSVGLDSAFLTASAAESAVTLNASITVPSGTNLTGASVYSKEASTTHGQSIVHHIGYNATRGTAYTFVKFDLSALANIRYDNITSACYRFTEGSSNDTTAVLQAYFVKSAWNESTITWNNKPAYYNEIIAASNINSSRNGSQYDLYITKAVQGWLQGLPNYGIMFREKDDDQWQTLFSDNRAINQPCLVVTYVDDAAPTQAPGIKNNTLYYLLNKANGKQLAAAGTTTGSYVTENSSAAIAQKVWTISSRGNNYYSLTCNGLALTTNSTVNGSTIKLQPYSSTDNRQLWKIIRNWDGSYQLINKAAEFRPLCLSGGAQTNGTNVKLAAHTFEVDTTKQNTDWTLIPAVKGTASFFYDSGFYDSQSVMETYRRTIANMMSFSNTLGYDAIRRDDVVYNVFSNSLENDSIVVAYSHGGPSSQRFGGYGLLTYDTIPRYTLPHMQLMLYCGCEAGANTSDDSTSLAGLTYKQGAHNVISFVKQTNFWQSSVWNPSLFAALSVGYTLGEAKEHADNSLYEKYEATANQDVYGNLNDRHDLGDNSFYFNLPAYSASSVNSSTSSPQNSVEDIRMGRFVEGQNILLDKNNLLSTGTDIGENTYNVYKDVSNNVYFVRSATNALEVYLPSTAGLELGNTIVDSQTALQQANSFLASSGYDISGFTITHSNEYSTKYQITYHYDINGINTTEKLCLYFEAEADGTVHLVRFAAYDYGDFSAHNVAVIPSEDYASLWDSVKLTAAVKASGNPYTMTEPIWTRNISGALQLCAYISFDDQEGNTLTEPVYSNILRKESFK